MEKVKITQEQADAIEALIADHGHKYDRFIKEHADDKNWFTINHEPIREIKIEYFARALYIGYEVEPEFEINDWVKSKHGKGIGIIKRVNYMGYWTDFGLIADHDDIRHATLEEMTKEKERRWWRRHDRDVWGIKEDDILVCPRGEAYTVEMISGGVVVFREGGDKQMGKIESEYKVVCFAEDRKDV